MSEAALSPQDRAEKAWQRTRQLKQENLDEGLATGGGGGDSNGMEPRISAIEVRLSHVEGSLTELRTEARQHRNTIIFTVLTSAIALFGLFYAAQSTLLSAFQSGLSAVQGVTASRPQEQAPPPVIINIPPQQQAPPPPAQ